MNHFFDIGANVGQTFTDYLTKTDKYDGWTIWCFEPSPRHLPPLMSEVKKWSDRYKIIVCPFGVWSHTDILSFYQKDDPRGDSFESYLASDHVTNNIEGEYQLLCPVMGINELLKSVDEVEVKLDCEGAEYPVLEALIGSPYLSKIKALYVEFHTIGTAHREPSDIIASFPIPIIPWTF